MQALDLARTCDQGRNRTHGLILDLGYVDEPSLDPKDRFTLNNIVLEPLHKVRDRWGKVGDEMLRENEGKMDR